MTISPTRVLCVVKKMRLLTWNINSARLRLPLLLQLSEALRPDVICLQEIKGETSVFPAQPLHKAGYVHQAIRGMKGYNGVAILSRLPFAKTEGLCWCGKDDARHIAVTFNNSVELHNFYIPAGGDIPDVTINEKFAHKLQFLDEMTAWSAKGKKKKRIIVGDFNVAPLPEDVWSHKQMLGVVSHTPIEVEKLTQMQQAGGFVDASRHLLPAPLKLFSWWSYRAADWQASNRGRRLDHIWLTPDLVPQLKDGDVYKDARSYPQPSDHAPVWVDLEW